MVHCMTTSYSVLMSVYAKENANYLSAAIESMLCQSCPPTQFVLVCDGPLTPALDKVIIDFTAAHPDLFRILRLPENQGLGFALQEGLSACECQLVARMDSDDIALPLRMEHQLAAMVADPCLDVVGGQIAEFVGDPRNIQGYRMVPISPEEVRQRAVRRNPINHMTVLFRRDAVLAAGNYQDMKGFEDYFLWGRMLASGCRIANLPEICVLARVAGLQMRRGGRNYFRQTVRLERSLRGCGLISVWDYYKNLLVRFCGTVLLPNSLRQRAYQRYLRQESAPEIPWAGPLPKMPASTALSMAKIQTSE